MTARQVEIEAGMAEPPPPMDLVIINPPFTRDSLRHDQFSRRDELAIKQREKEVFAQSAVPTCQGIAETFLVLAEYLNNQGQVVRLPLSCLLWESPTKSAAFGYRVNFSEVATM